MYGYGILPQNVEKIAQEMHPAGALAL